MTTLTTLETTEEVGPFTLFLRADPEGWPYYARPRLGHGGVFSAAHVDAARERQRALGVPEAYEWVHETTPTLLSAARTAGLRVDECPLLVLPPGAVPVTPALADGLRVDAVTASSPELSEVLATVSAGFAGSDDVEPRGPGRWPAMLEAGLARLVGAYDPSGPLGGGTHNPRGATTELAGIAVLPRARRQGLGAAITAALVDDARLLGSETIFLSAQDDAVARIYEHVGFVRVGTACLASPVETA